MEGRSSTGRPFPFVRYRVVMAFEFERFLSGSHGGSSSGGRAPTFGEADPDELRKMLEESGVYFNDRSRTSYVLACPRCGRDKKLFIRKRDGRFVCWRCRETDNFQGRPEYVLVELLRIPIEQIKSRLYGGIDIPAGGISLDVSLRDFLGEEEGEDDLLPDEADEIEEIPWGWDCYRLNQPEARRGATYLEGRGVSADIAASYDIRYQPRSRRVLFPVTAGGRLLGWQGRFIDNNKVYNEVGELCETPKALSTKDIPRDRVFMFSDRLIGSQHAVLCEGPVDALKAHLCGGNVASMGKAVSRLQMKLLRNAGLKRLYLALDPDAADETGRLVREFSDEMECFWMLPPAPYKDLGEMDMRDVLELFRGAERVDDRRLFVFLPSLY
jgi:hypothetical protein